MVTFDALDNLVFRGLRLRLLALLCCRGLRASRSKVDVYGFRDWSCLFLPWFPVSLSGFPAASIPSLPLANPRSTTPSCFIESGGEEFKEFVALGIIKRLIWGSILSFPADHRVSYSLKLLVLPLISLIIIPYVIPLKAV